MFEKLSLKKKSGAKIKTVTYLGVTLWVPEDFYDRPVEYGSVIFHLESVKRGYQLHALAGSRDSISANISFDTYYANLTTSMLNFLGKNAYIVKTKFIFEEKNRTITTEVYQYDWEGSDMQICYMWIFFEKTEQYVLLYATGAAHNIKKRYDELVAIAKTVTV